MVALDQAEEELEPEVISDDDDDEPPPLTPHEKTGQKFEPPKRAGEDARAAPQGADASAEQVRPRPQEEDDEVEDVDDDDDDDLPPLTPHGPLSRPLAPPRLEPVDAKADAEGEPKVEPKAEPADEAAPTAAPKHGGPKGAGKGLGATRGFGVRGFGGGRAEEGARPRGFAALAKAARAAEPPAQAEAEAALEERPREEPKEELEEGLQATSRGGSEEPEVTASGDRGGGDRLKPEVTTNGTEPEVKDPEPEEESEDEVLDADDDDDDDVVGAGRDQAPAPAPEPRPAPQAAVPATRPMAPRAKFPPSAAAKGLFARAAARVAPVAAPAPPPSPPPKEEEPAEEEEDDEPEAIDASDEEDAEAADKAGPRGDGAGDGGGDDDDDEPKFRNSANTPFPDELRAARLRLAQVQGTGKDEAVASLALSEVLLNCARFKEALKLAKVALAIFDPREVRRRAGAVRQIVKVLLGDERVDEAHELAEGQLTKLLKADDRGAEAIVKCALADIHLAMDRPKAALKVVTAALKTFKELGDDAETASALMIMANANLRHGDNLHIERALQDAEEALAAFRQAENVKEETNALLFMSKAHILKQDVQQAYAFADNAVEISRKSDSKRAQGSALVEVAMVLFTAREEPDMALGAGTEAVQLFEEIGDPVGEVNAWHRVACAYCMAGKTDEALEAMETALALARELGDRRLIGTGLELIMQIYSSKGGPPQCNEDSLVLMEKERVLARNSGDPRRELAAFQKVVSLQTMLEKVDDALATAEGAVELFASGDKKVAAWSLQLLAEVHVAMKKHRQALECIAKAKGMLTELTDMRELAEMIQMQFDTYLDMGDATEALFARNEQRMQYQASGWKDEEATMLLSIAELQLQTRGPREALKTGKEAVLLFQEMQDKSGEAQAMIALSTIQASNKAATDALKSTTSARRLFQALGDPVGEASAIQAAANVYLENGAVEEAVRVAKDARDVCKRASQKRAEAEALRVVSQIRLGALDKDAQTGRRPPQKAIEDAVEATAELADFLQSTADTEAHIAACIQLSSLHLMNRSGEAALKAAEEALEVAVKEDSAQAVGAALLAVSEAHIALGSGEEAQQAAEDAAALFHQTGDKAGIECAMQLVEAAKQELAKPKEATPPPSTAADKETPSKGGMPLESRELPASQRGPRGAPPRWARPKGPESDQPRSEHPLRPPAPDQDKRRQQLLAANEAKPLPTAPAEPERPSRAMGARGSAWSSATAPPPEAAAQPAAAPSDPALDNVLGVVRPDWSAVELRLVKSKLATIQICNLDDLYKRLRSDGAAGVNQQLRDAGQRALKADTLEAIIRYSAQME